MRKLMTFLVNLNVETSFVDIFLKSEMIKVKIPRKMKLKKNRRIYKCKQLVYRWCILTLTFKLNIK